jgi:hypothetical protein
MCIFTKITYITCNHTAEELRQGCCRFGTLGSCRGRWRIIDQATLPQSQCPICAPAWQETAATEAHQTGRIGPVFGAATGAAMACPGLRDVNPYSLTNLSQHHSAHRGSIRHENPYTQHAYAYQTPRTYLEEPPRLPNPHNEGHQMRSMVSSGTGSDTAPRTTLSDQQARFHFRGRFSVAPMEWGSNNDTTTGTTYIDESGLPPSSTQTSTANERETVYISPSDHQGGHQSESCSARRLSLQISNYTPLLPSSASDDGSHRQQRRLTAAEVSRFVDRNQQRYQNLDRGAGHFGVFYVGENKPGQRRSQRRTRKSKKEDD